MLHVPPPRLLAPYFIRDDETAVWFHSRSRCLNQPTARLPKAAMFSALGWLWTLLSVLQVLAVILLASVAVGSGHHYINRRGEEEIAAAGAGGGGASCHWRRHR